jgi:hypothetical protein
MKHFTSIQEWENSKPSQEEVHKVLGLINKQFDRELRFEILKKEGNLKKIEKTYDFMTEQGFKMDQNFKAKKKELESEIISLRKLLPVAKPKPIKVAKAEEPKKEE